MILPALRHDVPHPVGAADIFLVTTVPVSRLIWEIDDPDQS